MSDDCNAQKSLNKPNQSNLETCVNREWETP